MTANLRPHWQSWGMCLSLMRFRQRTARMLQLLVLLIICQLMQVMRLALS